MCAKVHTFCVHPGETRRSCKLRQRLIQNGGAYAPDAEGRRACAPSASVGIMRACTGACVHLYFRSRLGSSRSGKRDPLNSHSCIRVTGPRASSASPDNVDNDVRTEDQLFAINDERQRQARRDPGRKAGEVLGKNSRQRVDLQRVASPVLALDRLGQVVYQLR